MQEAIKQWEEEIGNLLPNNLEEIAKATGAIVRKRGVKDIKGFIAILFIFAVTTLSLRQISLSAKALGVSTMTDTAWRKRIGKATKFLTVVLGHVLPKSKQEKPVEGRTIKLIDATRILQEGKEHKEHRVHMSYNLTSGCMDEIKITDVHTAESFKHYTIQAGDIYMGDACYGKAKEYRRIICSKADCILRVAPSQVRLIDKKGKKINMVNKLDKKKQIIDFTCYMEDKEGLVPVRIVASQLPEDKQIEAIKKKKMKASKSQRKIKTETIEYARWVIVSTSLSREEYAAENILTIYRSRWQIELLFKRIKQHFKISKIRLATDKYVQALILLWLIIWAIAERQTIAAERLIISKHLNAHRLSLWNLSSYFFKRIKTIIELSWPTLLNPVDDIEIIAKYLQNHKDSRQSQYFASHICNFSNLAA